MARAGQAFVRLPVRRNTVYFSEGEFACRLGLTVGSPGGRPVCFPPARGGERGLPRASGFGAEPRHLLVVGPEALPAGGRRPTRSGLKVVALWDLAMAL